MRSAAFPLPVSMFSRDLLQVCSAALNDAWEFLGPQREKLNLTPDIVRISLAHGIVLAVTIGVRDRQRLAQAALGYLERDTQRSLPTLEPINGEEAEALDAKRFRYRAEEVRAALNEIKTPACRDALSAVAEDYDRMAQSAERIATSRAVIYAQAD